MRWFERLWLTNHRIIEKIDKKMTIHQTEKRKNTAILRRSPLGLMNWRKKKCINGKLGLETNDSFIFSSFVPQAFYQFLNLKCRKMNYTWNAAIAEIRCHIFWIHFFLKKNSFEYSFFWTNCFFQEIWWNFRKNCFLVGVKCKRRKNDICRNNWKTKNLCEMLEKYVNPLCSLNFVWNSIFHQKLPWMEIALESNIVLNLAQFNIIFELWTCLSSFDNQKNFEVQPSGTFEVCF